MWKLSILRLAFELQLKATMFHHNTIPKCHYVISQCFLCFGSIKCLLSSSRRGRCTMLRIRLEDEFLDAFRHMPPVPTASSPSFLCLCSSHLSVECQAAGGDRS